MYIFKSDKNTFIILLPVVVAGVVVATVGDVSVGDWLVVVTSGTCLLTKSNKQLVFQGHAITYYFFRVRKQNV